MAVRYQYIQLIQRMDSNFRYQEQITGIFNPAGWGAYFCNNFLFVKHAPVSPAATYPDFGCNFEIFTNRDFLELETLGPKVVLPSGAHVTHTETWQLLHDVPAGDDEQWIRSVLLPLVKST